VNVIMIQINEKRNLVILLKDQTEFKRSEIERMEKEYQNLIIETISHELRTPLNGIRGNFEIIQEKCKSSEIEIHAENGLRSSQMLFYLIKNAHTLALIQSKTFKLKMEGFYIIDVLSSVSDLIQTELKQRNVNFTIDIHPNLPEFIYSDRSCLEQILVILLSNAAKYTFHGFIKIQIEWSNQAKAPAIQFKISDTGIGIPKEQLHNIFEIFSSIKKKSAHKHG
jgi:signal transduction histidine kinase